jgi:monoamine oxidase
LHIIVMAASPSMKNTVFHTMALLVISFDLVATVKVVVVGAGTSGLAAARTLTDTWDTDENGGPLELTVLEAGTRIGGRTWTLNASEAGAAWNTAGALGAPTDMGASWIHGSTSTHPITKIATALGLAAGSGLVRTRDNLAELRLCTAGKTSACSEPNNDEFTAYENLLSQAQESAEDSDTDISLWQALSGLSSSGQNRESKLFQYHLATGAEFNTAGPVTQLSAWNYDDDSQYSGTELVWAQGYKVMYEALQSGAVRVNDGSSTLQVAAVASASRQPILVTYNKRVTSVTYSSTGVVLTTADGSTYNADYVIITIPLGVLKSTDASSRVTFSPALPPATANGISQLGFGNVVKIALLFPTVWWPTGTHYYGLAQAGTDRGLFTYFLNVHALSTKPVLMTFALGASADTAEGMSNAAVWTQVRSPSLLQHTSCASRAWA